MEDPFAAAKLDRFPPALPQRPNKSTNSPSLPPILPPISSSDQSPSLRFSRLYSQDFDSYIGSSPDDSSTPGIRRLKLKPTRGEDGNKGKLVMVSASTPSLLDNTPTSPRFRREARSEPSIVRMELSGRVGRQANRLAVPEDLRRKKHPSPSKEELEALGRGFPQYSSMMLRSSPSRPFPPMTPLADKDTNLSARNQSEGVTPAVRARRTKSEQTTSQVPRRPMIPKSATGELLTRRPPPTLHLDSSYLDDSSIDELQWSGDKYQVGRRRG